MTKIAISGIGGVGGFYGGTLAHHYADTPDIEIDFIARGAHLEKIRTEGLTVLGKEAEFTAHPTIATNRPEEIGTADFLIIATKSYDLEENVRSLAPIIAPHTVIIPLLNGLGIPERIQAIYPDNRVWYGCTYVVSYIESVGVIRETTNKRRLIFGSATPNDPDVERLAGICRNAGINVETPEDIVATIWKKFFFISPAATITSYYNSNYGHILVDKQPEYIELLRELYAISQAKGIRLPADIVERTLDTSSYVPADATTSMHKDFKAGKPTELELLAGYVIEMGKITGIPTPNYEKMYHFLKTTDIYSSPR